MKTQKTHCNPASNRGIQGYGLAISVCKKGMKWWNQGSLRRHKCNVRRNRNLVSPVHIGSSSSLLVVGRASRCRLLTPACWFLSLHLHVGSDWKSFLLVTFGDQEKHVFGVRGCLDSLKKMFCCVRCGFGYSFLIV